MDVRESKKDERRKALEHHTNSLAVRGRPTLKEDQEYQFRAETNYRDFYSTDSKNSTSSNSYNSQTISNHYQNTNCLVHSSTDEPPASLKLARIDCISGSWSFGLAISLLCFVLIIYSLNSYSLLLSLIVVVCVPAFLIFHVASQFNEFVCLTNNSYVFEKAEHLSNRTYVPQTTVEQRSRYAKFFVLKCQKLHHTYREKRDREPSRIPVKKLERIMNKSRLVRREIRMYIAKNIPMSSKIHCYVNKCNFLHDNSNTIFFRRKNVQKNIKPIHWKSKYEGIRRKKNKTNSAIKRKANSFIYKYLSSCYKNLNHVINYCKFSLSKDIEKNPGPNYNIIDPNQTICAPYSQGNIALFGLNAGKQCVAMSLCALIYNNHHNSITSSADLIKILTIGNELYSVLSRLYNEDFLLLTELPNVITVFDCNYEMQYSPSYTGNIWTSSSIDFQFCMPYGNAMQILIDEGYNMFLLTILCNTVAIYVTSNGKFKLFDSHSRDQFGLQNPQGTCVLITINNLEIFVNFLQTMYCDQDMTKLSYELRGVNISEQTWTDDVQTISTTSVEKNLSSNETVNHANISDSDETANSPANCDKTSNNDIKTAKNITLSCSLSLYCICFSVIKTCNYWKSETLNAIYDHGRKLHEECLRNLDIIDFPKEISIYNANITISIKKEKYGTINIDSCNGLQELKHIVLQYSEGNTGFMLLFAGFCIACIFHKKARTTDYYLVQINEDSEFEIFEKATNLQMLIEKILHISEIKAKTSETNTIQYDIKFLTCSTRLSNLKRNNILRRHKSFSEKNNISEKKKQYYETMEPVKKKQCLTKMRINRHKQYNSMNSEKRAKELANKRSHWHKHNSVNVQAKEKKLENMRTQRQNHYNSMNSLEKEKELENMRIRKRIWYKNLDERQKKELNEKKKKLYNLRKATCHDLDHYILSFRKKICEGPFFICIVCHRLLYKKTVRIFDETKYIVSDKGIFAYKKSFDGKQYICITCHTKLLKQQVPCQAVCNDLKVEDIPPELAILGKLEQILIAKRIVFEKILVMPKGSQRKIKGAICNVPVECDKTCNVLPRAPEASGIIALKLKRKLQFRGHVYHKNVRPEMLHHALNWLKLNNSLYSDIIINEEHSHENVLSIRRLTSHQTCQGNYEETQESCEQTITYDDDEVEEITESNCETQNLSNQDIAIDTLDEIEEIDDPLNDHRMPTNETCLQSVIPNYQIQFDDTPEVARGNEIHEIAPGENRHPVSFMTDKLCEEMAFPVLFPKGKFGYHHERPVKLSPVKYFNARLLHHSGRFATNPEYLFFAQFIIEQKKVFDSINIALKKIQSQPISASQLRSNDHSLQNLICQDQAYLFLRQIPGTPPYWQKFMYEVVAMVKQLGIPTWFMTLSCADLRWPDLFEIIEKTQGRDVSTDDFENLTWQEKCKKLNLNPVVVAKHFQYRVETFFSEVLLSNANPIGKIIYYALRIEFQMRGSPHLHALIWTSDCPKLNKDSKQQYIEYVDRHVQAYLPDENEDPQLHELVKKYQKHNHSKTCRKYKNIRCRFNFGQFFTERTIVAEPLSDDILVEVKQATLEKRKEILTLVKEKIDDVLNPSKDSYNCTLKQSDIFRSVGITEEEYYNSLSISPDSDYELHLKRPLNSCFINNYFVAGLKGFAANVDLQPVFNHYKCITYVCSYFTKDETECSQAIMNAAKEAKAANMNVREGLKKIGAAFLSTREVSSQEAAYRCMPELWLRKIFPGTVFVNTDLPDKRIRMAKSQQELEELDDDSTDVFKSNIIQRYSKRPHVPCVDNLCLAEFSAIYYKEYNIKSQENSDAQPEVLSENLVEANHTSCEITPLPEKIRLIDSNETMKRRKVKAVIRYHTPNKQKEPEKYFHHLLMLYYPWRDENQLLASDSTYATKIYEPDVQSVVEQNKSMFEPDTDAVAEALETLRNNDGLIHSYDSMNDQENDDLQSQIVDESNDESFHEQLPSHLSLSSDSDRHESQAISRYVVVSDITDDELRGSVRSLNSRQRHTYNYVLEWCRNTVKNMNSLQPQKVEEIFVFLTGGGGAGKSHLITAIYHTVTKAFKHTATNIERPSVLLMAPTGVSAININGTTVNTALGIPKEAGLTLKPLSDQNRTQLRLALSELKLIIIDEISMVGNITLLNIHQRLKEIFDTPASKLFAGISIIAGGDFHQLPPIKKKPVFENFNNETYNLCHPWHLFRMTELVKNMRSKDDQPFVEMLNRFRTATQTEEDIKIINSRSIDLIDPNSEEYPSDAIHIYAENKPVDDHNINKLTQLPGNLYVLRARDQYPPNVSQTDINRVLSKGRSDTGGLDYDISIKERARVMLTNNIDIADRLINGQIGTVIKVDVDQNTQKPRFVYIKFDDEKAGKNLINKCTDQFAKDNNVVPIGPILAKIKIRLGKPSSPEIQRVQFPITLAFAVTVHKVQGLSLDKVVISFELFKQKTFNYGQVYVALSRARSLRGLYILGQLQAKHVKSDPRVIKEYQRMRETLPLEPPKSLQPDPAIWTISLLNIRSLRKHSIDVKHDRNLFDSDIICFTETQLLSTTDDTEIVENLHPFMIERQDHSDRYSSLAVCTKPNVTIEKKVYIPQINSLILTIDLNTHIKLNILLLYRKNGSSIPQFISHLEYALNRNKIDIVLGDFNINYLDNTIAEPLQITFQQLNYTQTVLNPTFVAAGSLIDHVYIRNQILSSTSTTSIPIYYSDHDALKLSVNIQNLK